MPSATHQRSTMSQVPLAAYHALSYSKLSHNTLGYPPLPTITPNAYHASNYLQLHTMLTAIPS